MRNLSVSAALVTTALVLSACSGDSTEPAANVPPPIAGISPDQVQAELAGLECAATQEILDTPDMTQDLYFGTMADYVSGSVGGSSSEWRAAIDWWWSSACGGQ